MVTTMSFGQILKDLSPETPVLIAGPTASGKSALALDIAQHQGGVIVNADASQIYACWDVITACPSAKERAQAPHQLYRHVQYDQPYSAGHWLRDVQLLLKQDIRPIIVGGTGLYLSALTEGLSEIPAIPDAVRTKADALSLETMQAALDPETKARIDLANRARVQRAWEVQHHTGRALSAWQDDPTDATLPVEQTAAFVFDAPKEWLTPRIELRFDQMMDLGALDEVQEMRPHYDPNLPAFRAIGVPELTALAQGDITQAEARERVIIATRRYAKRQRTWFRKRCSNWHWLDAAT